MFHLLQKYAGEVLKKNARWIVSTDGEDPGELGIRVLGINLWYYKWPDPMVCEDPRPWRYAEKREFGEVVHSVKGR